MWFVSTQHKITTRHRAKVSHKKKNNSNEMYEFWVRYEEQKIRVNINKKKILKIFSIILNIFSINWAIQI